MSNLVIQCILLSLLGLLRETQVKGYLTGAVITQKLLHHQTDLPSMDDDSGKLQLCNSLGSLQAVPSTNMSFCSWAIRASTPSNCLFIPVYTLGGDPQETPNFCLKAHVTFCDFCLPPEVCEPLFHPGGNVSIWSECCNSERHAVEQ